MIQELFGGTNGLISNGHGGGGERKVPNNGTSVLEGSSTVFSSSNSITKQSKPQSVVPNNNNNSSTTSSNSADQTQNLRCPRCDSSNTKFCYYNNYNLTQPRHFCKTCRRYWTKGGALRNVPIGGGCRKNRTGSASNTGSISASLVKSNISSSSSSNLAVNKMMKSISSTDQINGMRSSSQFTGYENELTMSSPVLWASPQNSHILTLLRASQNQNQNQNPNPNCNTNNNNNNNNINNIPMLSYQVDEATGFRTQMVSNEGGGGGGSVLNGRILHAGLDPLAGQVSSLGLCGSFWRNNQQQQQSGFVVGQDQPQNGIQDLYQRLRSPATSYYPASAGHHQAQQEAMGLSNVVSPNNNSTTSTPTTTPVAVVLESAPVSAASELGYWNPAFSWADLPAANGAYP